MIVYVESNFILELVLAQEESNSAEQVLDLAIFDDSIRYQEEYGLSPQDAIIYSSIITNVKQHIW